MPKNDYFIIDDTIMSGGSGLDLSGLKGRVLDPQNVCLIMRGDTVRFVVTGKDASERAQRMVEWCNTHEKLDRLPLRAVLLQDAKFRRESGYSFMR